VTRSHWNLGSGERDGRSQQTEEQPQRRKSPERKDGSLSREWEGAPGAPRWRSSGNLDERAGVPGEQWEQTPLHRMRENVRESRDRNPESLPENFPL